MNMGEEEEFGGANASGNRDAEPRNSAIRDRIRSRLGGMKQL
jgi:hypothetical protein